MGLFKWKKTEKDEEVTKTDKPSGGVKSTKSEPAKATMKDLYADGQAPVRPAVSGKAAVPAKQPGLFSHILIKPLVTEKATNLGAMNKYAFAVADSANKIEITKAISAVYGIKPVSVRVIGMKGKKVRHGRIIGRRKDWKKAIVTLPAGQTINIYEGV